MELEEMKSALNETNHRLDELFARQASSERLLRRVKSRRTLMKLRGLPITDVIGGVVSTMLLGNFIYKVRAEPKFLIPALFLDALAIFTIAAGVWQLARISQIDFSDTVVESQKKLAAQKTFRVKMTQWILMSGPLVWTPLQVVLARVVGFDVYRLGIPYILANLLFGLCFLAFCLWASKTFAAQFSQSSALKAIAASFAGQTLSAAEAQLAEINDFERG